MNSTPPFLPWMPEKAATGLIALKSEMDWDQTAMGLPPVPSAIILIGILVECVCYCGISEISLLPYRGKSVCSEWYLCIYFIMVC
jgi:hypothetical protein